MSPISKFSLTSPAFTKTNQPVLLSLCNFRFLSNSTHNNISHGIITTDLQLSIFNLQICLLIANLFLVQVTLSSVAKLTFWKYQLSFYYSKSIQDSILHKILPGIGGSSQLRLALLLIINTEEVTYAKVKKLKIPTFLISSPDDSSVPEVWPFHLSVFLLIWFLLLWMLSFIFIYLITIHSSRSSFNASLLMKTFLTM